MTAWDLVIFDEAHHLTKPGVMRYELGQLLRKTGKARNVLFLTATPHSGNHERLFVTSYTCSGPDLVDPPSRGEKTVQNIPLAEMMIRNRKHLVTDGKRNKIFHGIAKSLIFSFRPTSAEIAFADEVREYLRKGYDHPQARWSDGGGRRLFDGDVRQACSILPRGTPLGLVAIGAIFAWQRG